MKTFAFRSAVLGAAAVALALGASAAQATTVHDGQGLLPTFDPNGATTTDNFRDLDVKSATVSYDAKFVYLNATMYGDIGSTEHGFYAWGINTGAGTDFFQFLHDKMGQVDVGPDGDTVAFDTFILLNPDGTGAVHYLTKSDVDPLVKLTVDGSSIRAVISRETLEDDATVDISKWGFNIWPRTNDLGNASISDFAPNGHNFNATASVPEPATWALMIAGFGLAGSTLRRRRSSPLAM